MQILIFTLLALLAEVIGTVGGFGSSLFFVPVAQFFFATKTVLGITSVFHVFSNLSKIVLFRKTINWRLTLLFGIPSVLLVILGAWLTTVVAFKYDKLTLAVFLIIFSGYMLLNPTFTVKATAATSIAGGGLAGFLAGFIGTGGAIRGLCLAAYNLEKSLFVGTSAAIDMGVDISRAAIYLGSDYLQPHEYYLIPILVVVSLVGSYLGKVLLKRVNQDTFKKAVLYLILGVGLIMVWQNVTALI